MTSAIEAKDLVPGKCYFLLSYYDRDLRLPEIATLVYVGANLFPGDKKRKKEAHYFQTAESYAKKGLFKGDGKEASRQLTVVPDDSLLMIYDREGLIAELRK